VTITIPPEAEEAAAEAEYYAHFGDSAGPWESAPEWVKEQAREHARAALSQPAQPAPEKGT
jgi:hypothetical protein